jgi:hypothetical protein
LYLSWLFAFLFPLPFGKQIWDIKEGENGSGTGINSRA